MLFSPPCEHAIRALIYLASQTSESPVSVAIIAKNSDVPSQFLAKILLQLKNHRIVRSMKGPGGGYLLAKSPGDIRLIDISSVFDSPQKTQTQCILGLEICMDSHPCPLHHEWQRFRANLAVQFHEITLSDLRDKLAEKRFYIANQREG